MTLAEIMVCLGVIAIVAGMVVSFATLMSGRTKGSTATLETQQDIQIIQAVAESWLERMTAAGATFSLSADSKTVTATVTETVIEDGQEVTVLTPYTLQFAYGKLSGTAADSEPMTVVTEHIQNVTFTILQGSGDCLLLCHVTDSGSQTISFAINPRIGETVGG